MHSIRDKYEDTSKVTFDSVVVGLKHGLRFARAGWNGKGMYIRYVNPHCDPLVKSADNHAKADGTPLPWIGMKTADGGFVPWLASQTDILASDWEIAR